MAQQRTVRWDNGEVFVGRRGGNHQGGSARGGTHADLTPTTMSGTKVGTG